MKTYNELCMDCRRALLQAGVADAGWEARVLLAAAGEKTMAELVRDLRLYPASEVPDRAAEFLRRRLAGEPLAYIVGHWPFRELELEVCPGVLIPRSDTEVVTEAALEFLRGSPEARVLDLCAGSGCIGLALAAAVPGCRVVLADIDPTALRLMRHNALRCRMGSRAICVAADALHPPAAALGSFDLIVSNPPYVPTAEIDTLEPSVKDYEPRLALDGGGDGLDFYRSIFAGWLEILKPGGCLALECGEGQSESLLQMGKAAGLGAPAVFRDTGGTERAVRFLK